VGGTVKKGVIARFNPNESRQAAIGRVVWAKSAAASEGGCCGALLRQGIKEKENAVLKRKLCAAEKKDK